MLSEVQMHESGSEPTSHIIPASQTENGNNSENGSRVRSSQTPPPEAPQVPESLSMMTPPAEAPQQLQQTPQQQVLSPQQLQALLQQQKALMLHQQQIQEVFKNQQEQLNIQLLQQKNAGIVSQELTAQQIAIQQQLLQVQQQHLLNLQRQGLLSVLPATPIALTGTFITFPLVMHEFKKATLANKVALKCVLTPGCENGSILPAGDTRESSSQQSTTNDHPALLKRTERGSLDENAQNSHALYGNGMCKWPGCETVFGDFQSFLKHLDGEHTLDDKSTAQCRVQMQVVQQLELQLRKDKERLQAMMAHLKSSESKPAAQPVNLVPNVSFSQATLPKSSPPISLSQSATAPSTPMTPLSEPPSVLTPPNSVFTGPPVRRRYSRSVSQDCHSTDIVDNKEFYLSTEVRPPFTYASLIRQAIFESPRNQLTLNEIYNWFTRNFAYFRRNAATWKNAVRHNLSLHKCFVRLENVKGAVWTVDEIEFHRRRPQKAAANGLNVRGFHETKGSGSAVCMLAAAHRSGGLDGNNSLYNPAFMGSIPFHSLSHVLQEQMNGALANGSGYQSDSSATQSPPQALFVYQTSIKEEQEDEEICEGYPYESPESTDEHGHSPEMHHDEDHGSPQRP
uniref:Fork-head domain-containing protein n=1 Tax=Gasterosteus aculeatus TaxID=69293 RepID=G3NGK6_GASAC